MGHYKLLLDPAKYLNEADFPKERAVIISRIVREPLPEREGEDKKSAPMLYIKNTAGGEYSRPMKVPKIIMHGLNLLFGPETDAWIGKDITIYATTCMAFGTVEPCLRVRFPAEIDGKIRAWMKKRKVNPKAYVIEERT